MVDVSQCNAALIRDTYKLQTWRFKDWRLAQRVTEDVYNTIKHDADANAEIYGIPIGASYSDFQNNVRKASSTRDESLREEEAVNILWTGLGTVAAGAYKQCLDSATNAPGIYLTIKHATATDVTIVIRWLPMGGVLEPEIEWSGPLANDPAIKHIKKVETGSRIVVIKRPQTEQQLAVRVKHHGATDSIILTPIAQQPPQPDAGATEFHLAANDRLQWLRRGQSIQWQTPRLQAGSYNASFSARLHPNPSGAQFRVNYDVLVNGNHISPSGAWVDLQFGDHPDVVNAANVVNLVEGPATIVLSIGGVFNADPVYGNFTNGDAGEVAASQSISISLKKV